MLIEDLMATDAEVMKQHWNVKPGDVCFDVGCGPGHWAMTAAHLGGVVFAFDPSLHALKETMAGALAHGLSFCVVPCGLWDDGGKLPFSGNSFGDCNSSFQARVMTMDEFVSTLNLDRLDFVNMDAEGSELRIVRGGRRTISRLRPKLVIEVHGNVDRGELKNEISGLAPYEFIDDGVFVIAKVGGSDGR